MPNLGYETNNLLTENFYKMKKHPLLYCFIFGLSLFRISSCQDSQTKQDLLNYQQSEVRATENAEVVKRSFELLDDLDMEAYNELLEPDHKIFMGSSKESIQFSDITPFIRTVYKSFPDYKHTVKNIIATEDYVVAQIQLSGTHTNAYHETEPTGNQIEYAGVFIFKMVDGKISEICVLEDDLTRDSQLGFSL